ncbi:MAG: TMEM14 family protein [Simkania negevensis]|nr:TMEM14 family protein [Simkania negevensis]
MEQGKVLTGKFFKFTGILVLSYSILLFMGGFIGFLTKRSLPSLLMGSTFSLSLLFSAVLLLSYRRWGIYLSFLLLLLLEGFFALRYILSFQFLPSGLMFFLTTVTLFLFFLKLFKMLKDRS